MIVDPLLKLIEAQAASGLLIRPSAPPTLERRSGSLPLSKLVDEVGAPKDLALLALGWLAREGKITIEESGRKKMVNLRD